MQLGLPFLIAILPAFVLSLAPTDEIQDADPAQSGYLDNHNLHPATVGSSIFGILWKKTYGVENELWYARPLIYTPPGASQLVFMASNKNTLRTLDAVNGTILNSRTVQPPFLASDMRCGDIPNFVGVTGTPIIDPSTNTAYFFSKGYKYGAAAGGVLNGRYLFYAVDAQTLQDRPGFPVLIDGHFADNDRSRYFLGGTVLQRPSLALLNGVVIGAFGGHCDLFNYTGMLVAVSTTSGVGVTSMFAMESSPGAPPVQLNYLAESGGKAGIWQSGMAISVDAATNRIFIVTGNGQGHANGDVVASGRTPLSTLDEVVASFEISLDGKISLNDYFEPYEYISMDAGDRDLGSSGVTLLDSKPFSTSGVSRIALTGGKNSKVYIMNANNLGGFKQGIGGVDNILQTISLDAPIFGGIGSYPLEGGYIYFTPIGGATVAYQMGLDTSGTPQFTKVGQSLTNGAGRVGIGIPTVTTFKGQAGTGILWITDPSNGLQAFKAVPVNNQLVAIPLPPTGGITKFMRPAFGDGRVYASDSKGNVICLGSPVALPLQCSQPVDYGKVNIGNSATQIVTCKTLIAITSINGCTTGNADWKCVNSTLPKGPLAQGVTFSFPVTWDLTHVTISDTPNASFGKVEPGVASSSLNLYTTNAVPQYSNIYPVSLIGTEVSSGAFLKISPVEVDLGGVVVNSGGINSILAGSVVVSNAGSQILTILGSAWTPNIDASDGKVIYTNVTAPNSNLGNGFISDSFPGPGTIIAPGRSLTIPLKFVAAKIGAFTTFLQLWTSGGTSYVLISASSVTAPVAEIAVSFPGGYRSGQPLVMDFGNVLAGSTQTRDIKICNSGGSDLLITKSKPPDEPELFAPNEATDLHEGQNIAAGSCALGQVTVNAAPLGVNRPDHTVSAGWILNTNDPNFGLREVEIIANVVTRQVGPQLSDGFAQFTYLGCYYDGAGRLFAGSKTDQNKNENGLCQTQCAKGGYTFAGTEYHTECWCGNTPPTYTKFTIEWEKKCQMACPGDGTQACGGDGTYVSVYYDRNKYSPGPDTIPGFTSSSVKPSSSVSRPSVPSSLFTSRSLSSAKPPSSAVSSSNELPSTSSILVTVSKPASSISSKPSAIAGPTEPTTLPKVGAYLYIGCYTEGGSGRALTGKSSTGDTMTVEACYSLCTGFTYFGLEYHRECFCGNAINFGSTLAKPGATCSKTCAGNSSQICGGSSRISMYKLQSTVGSGLRILDLSSSSASDSPTLDPPTSNSSSVIPSAFKSTTLRTAKPPPLPIPSPAIQGSSSIGCFSDPAGGPYTGHNLPKLFTNDSMTPDLCISSALARLSATPATTYIFAALEYGRECYAGTAAPSPVPSLLTGPKACTMTCKGDGTKGCGGRNMYNLYAIAATGGVRSTAIATATP